MKSSLTIAYDTWTLQPRFRNHGIYVYAGRLLREFRKLAASHSVIVRPFLSSENCDDLGDVAPAPGFEPRVAACLRWDRTWRFVGAAWESFRSGADVTFCPTSSTHWCGWVPMVTTIHDVTPIRMPSHSRNVTAKLRFSMWCSARASAAILTDSKHSKADIVDIYGVKPENVTVVYLGYEDSLYNSEPADRDLQSSLWNRFGIRPPYIIHHGVIQPRKNLERLITAYAELRRRDRSSDVQLVLAGPRGWQYESVFRAAEQCRSRGIPLVTTGALPDPHMAALVKGATLAVIPSLYEGFCLPMVEAMASGVPTVASRSSCLPEVSGDKLVYFDPYSTEEMVEVIRKGLDDTGLRRKLREDGLKHVVSFCWQRCAEETLNAILAARGISPRPAAVSTAS
jgi:glycosyltransferase involved in cell wall biosynthesis